MAEEIKYIPYGNDEIDYNEFLTRAANNVQDYVAGRSWSTKRKKDFMDAYADIMSHGITGASVGEDGQWGINYTGTIDMDTKTDRQKEMYGAAAHFIQQQMKSIPIHKKEKEEEKKEDLPEMDYPTFESNFSKAFANKWFNGNTAIRNDWNNFDKRDETTGKRGIDERKRKMIEFLEEYHNNFDESKYSNGADIKGKIKGALDALRSENPDDDKEAFTRLGMNYDQFFDNGLNDDSGYYLGDRNLTWAEYIKTKEDTAKQKQETEKAALAKQKANQYTNFKFYTGVGTPLAQNEYNSQYLNGLSSRFNLTGPEQSKLVGVFRNAAKQGMLRDISKEEQVKFGNNWRPGRLKKIEGLNGVYWDSIGQRVVHPYNAVTQQQMGLTLDNYLQQNNPQIVAQQKKDKQRQANIENMNTPINWDNLDEATKNELWAVANDIGAFIDPGAVTGTALAMNAARLRDKNRPEGWSLERGLDWLTSGLGGLPVVGDALSVYKAGSNLIKLANASARIGSLIGAVFSAANAPEAWESMKKIYSKGFSSMTPQDIQNITYGLMGFAAGWKTINSVNSRPKTTTEKKPVLEVETQQGKQKIQLSDAEAQNVAKEYKAAKNNKEAADKVISMQEVREAAQRAGIDLTGAKLSKTSGVVRGNPLARKVGLAKSPISHEIVNTGTIESSSRYFMPSWRRNFLSTNRELPVGGVKRAWNWFMGNQPTSPINTNRQATNSANKSSQASNTSNSPSNSTQNNSGTSTPATGTSPRQPTGSNAKPKLRSLSKEESTELQSTLRGKNFSDNEFKDESRVVGSVKGFGDLYGIRNSDGTHTLQLDFGGTRIDVTGTKADIKSKALEALRKDVMKRIDAQIPKANRARIKYELTQLLKQNGYLKHGGLLQYKKDNTIENFLKEYNL